MEGLYKVRLGYGLGSCCLTDGSDVSLEEGEECGLLQCKSYLKEGKILAQLVQLATLKLGPNMFYRCPIDWGVWRDKVQFRL